MADPDLLKAAVEVLTRSRSAFPAHIGQSGEGLFTVRLSSAQLEALLSSLTSLQEENERLNLAWEAERKVARGAEKAAFEHVPALLDAYTALTASEAQAARYRKALEPFALFADFLASETEGFAEADELDLLYADTLLQRFKVGDFLRARQALAHQGGEE